MRSSRRVEARGRQQREQHEDFFVRERGEEGAQLGVGSFFEGLDRVDGDAQQGGCLLVVLAVEGEEDDLALLAQFTFSYGNDLIYQKDVTDMAMNSLANRGVSVFDGSTLYEINPKRPMSLYNGSINFLTNLNVYDASYLKLKTLSLSYTLPSKWLKKLHMSSASIYGTATNLFTITKYPGPDPEVSDDPRSIIGGGRDISSYPTTRSYTFGVRVGF